jgi:hypothetical protein
VRESSFDHAQAIACPRCGYDQRGVVATWTEQCPLEGTCAECGLSFPWCEVMYPEKFEPRWCVEYEPIWWRVPRAAARTFVKSFWPWGFWRRMKMSHPIRLPRMFAYVVLLQMPFLLGYVVEQGVAAIIMRAKIDRDMRARQAAAMADVARAQKILAANDLGPEYGNIDEATKTRILEQIKANLPWSQAIANSPASVNISYSVAAAEAILQPLATRSQGTVTEQGVTSPYEPPCRVHYAVLQWYWGIDNLKESAWESIYWLGIFVLVCAGMPISFVLLPVSMRHAKVRWTHILRISMYSTFIPIAVLWVMAGSFALGLLTRSTGDGWGRLMSLSTTWGIALMILAWWWAAIRCYLRIPHALFTTLTLALMCWLLIMAAMWFIAPEVLIELSL